MNSIIEKHTKEEILNLIEDGFRKLGARAGSVASMALLVALNTPLSADRINRAFERDLVLTDCKLALKHYGISEDYVPPRMLARQILAARTQANMLIRQLERVVGRPLAYEWPLMDLSIAELRSTVPSWAVESPSDAYVLSDAAIDELMAAMFG